MLEELRNRTKNILIESAKQIKQIEKEEALIEQIGDAGPLELIARGSEDLINEVQKTGYFSKEDKLKQEKKAREEAKAYALRRRAQSGKSVKESIDDLGRAAAKAKGVPYKTKRAEAIARLKRETAAAAKKKPRTYQLRGGKKV